MLEDFGGQRDEREARGLEGGLLGRDRGAEGVERGGDFGDRVVQV